MALANKEEMDRLGYPAGSAPPEGVGRRGSIIRGILALVSQLHPAVIAPLRAVVTARLSLRRTESGDLDELATVFADPEVWRFEYDRGLTRDETQAFIDRQTRMWSEYGFGGCAVRRLVAGTLVGIVGLGVPTVATELLPAITIGWRFSPSVWGRGVAAEAATALFDQAFTTMGVDRVGCVTDARNRRSVALAERLGMSVIADTSIPRDDGTGELTARLMELRRQAWKAPGVDGRHTAI